jgi:hypothetical protein
MTTANDTPRKIANRVKKVLDAAGFNKAESHKNARLGFAYTGAGYTVRVLHNRYIEVSVSATGTSFGYDLGDAEKDRDALDRAKAALIDAGFTVTSARGADFWVH